MLHIKEIIIVEGQYDAAKLTNIVDGIVITTNGFSIFSDEEKKELIRTLGARNGIIILTDSDAAGFKIRHYIEKIATNIPIKHAYIPEMMGKEKRKSEPSKEGTLGVEGIPDEIIIKALMQCGATENKEIVHTENFTYTDLYELGLSGTNGSAAFRRAFLKYIGMPQKMSKKGMVSVLNNLYSKEKIFELAKEKPVLFFDFHGTLTYPDNPWVEGAYYLANKYFSQGNITEEIIKKELSGRCLPWLEIESRDTRTLKQTGWWNFCNEQFLAMFIRAGMPEEEAKLATADMREYVLEPKRQRLYENSIPVLQELNRRGYKCYMVSNNFPEMKLLAQTLEIDKYFEEIFVSAEVGYAKPRKEIFELALTSAQNPVYPVMIGDNPSDDIVGAKKCGFVTIQMERYERVQEADFYCNSLQNLLELFL
jgi:haloacid dehalogenase superfamily, subfamily IA, variant 1 with third motif having Dx(3-4)D or Dx(3-4)E